MAWHEFLGRVRWQAGNAAGTVTIPAGATLLRIIAHSTSNATMTIFGGKDADSGNNTIVIVGGATQFPNYFEFQHMGLVAGNDATTAGSADIVLTGAGIDMWYVEYGIPVSGAAH